MSFSLFAFSNQGCQEHLLPEGEGAGCSVVLDSAILGTAESITVELDAAGGAWRLKSVSDNCLLGKGSLLPGQQLRDRERLYISSGTRSVVVLILEFSPGIDSMRKYALSGVSQFSFGSGNSDTIMAPGTFISEGQAVFSAMNNVWAVRSGAGGGTYVNGQPVHGTRYLEYGDCVMFPGARLVWLGDTVAVGSRCGALTCRLTPRTPSPYVTKTGAPPQKRVKEYYRRSPRNLPVLLDEKISIEAPPQPQRTARRPLLLTIGPSLTMALPMVVGTLIAVMGSRSGGSSSGMYTYTGIIIAIMSALIGTMWALVNISYAKKQEGEAERSRVEKYEKYIAAVEQDLSEKYTFNAQSLNYIYPDARTCAGYNEDTPELWNRNSSHADYLFFRLGIGAVPFQCPIVVPQQKFSMVEDELAAKPFELLKKYKDLKNVPVGIDLSGKKLVGVIGQSREKTAGILRDLVVQAAANDCYTDLKMVFLFDGRTPTDQEIWGFAKWLPHAWSADRKIRYFAADENERSEVCFHLANALRMRAEQQENSSGAKVRVRPYYLVFVSDPELLEGMPVSKYLLDYDGELGVTTILFASRYEQLPNNCVDIIQNDREFAGVFNTEHGSDARLHIQYDVIDGGTADEFARALSGVEVRELESGGEIPNSLSFLEMYQASTVEELKAGERWMRSRTYENMRAPVGQKAGGSTWNLDIHEKYHGPHGLVAGTTGSGKSETLQTYILSLAVNFSPSDVAFFLIDFKGGGMANLFAGLPHTAGCISNLSGNQIHRAMVSIKSENRRRQRLFGEYGVNHIDQYTKLFKKGEAPLPIPHLFIIIDEFAELKRDEPDFMRELISVAQVGRSLGVHLILATQKPGGTVDDNIWSNTRFRLCLRVQDRQDSNDVLHRPDAAYLTQAGRCYMQVGNDEIYELFQTAWSGAAYDEMGTSQAEIACMWNNIGQPAITGGKKQNRAEAKRRQPGQGQKEAKDRTQLDAVIEYLRQTAETGFPDREKFRLWLPIPSQELFLFDVWKEPTFDGEAWPDNDNSLSVPIGIYDDPANQAQAPLVVDLCSGGDLAVCGSIMSGKSTFLQTLLYALVNKYSPAQLNIYALDYSNHLLAPFEDLCHVGGVVYENDADKVEKLFVLLSNTLNERKRLFQGGSYTQFVKVNGQTIPFVLLVIDNYSSFREKTENKYESELITLSREGSNYGIYLIVTAGGFGAGELQNRIADNIRDVICLEMGDRFRYGEVLRAQHFDVFPETNVKGRGLASVDGRILEFQTALAFKAADDYERAEKLEVCFSEMNRVWSGKRAKKIPTIPEDPHWDDLAEYDDGAVPALTASGRVPYGWNSKDASIASVDLSRTYCWLISGKARSGKTNLLKVLASAAAMGECERYIFDFDGKLRRFAASNGAGYISDGKEMFEMLKELIPKFKERNRKKQELLAAGCDDGEMYEKMREFRPIFLFIDDLDQFVRIAYNPPEGVGAMAGFLENITEKGMLHNIFLFAACDCTNAVHASGRAVYTNILSYKCGIHLGGNVVSQRVFDFSSLSYLEQSKAARPGTGLVPPGDFDLAAHETVIPLYKG